ncbi:MAG: BatA domain-containing protein [Rhizobiaceae bacterium]|nr:BatA domain-containing protein [Rhizobiaceae bacterium]
MFGLPLAFGAPLVLFALLALPIIWYLLRLTPPKPQQEIFPPTRILATLLKREETPAQSPWWLTLLRLTLAALAILAMSLPMWNPEEATLSGDGTITLIIDDGWASGQNWDERKQSATKLINEARDADRLVSIIRTTAADETTSGPATQKTHLKS